MKSTKILCTSVGNDGFSGVYDALKGRENVHVTGADADPEVYGLLLADESVLIPKRDQPEELLTQIVQYYHDHQIDLLLPLSTEDQSFYSLYYDRLTKSGLNVAVSSYDSVEIVTDKHQLYRFCSENGFPVPAYELSDNAEVLIDLIKRYANWGEKCVLKKARGTGAQGVKIIDPELSFQSRFFSRDNIRISPGEVMDWLQNSESIPTLMLTEYLPGKHVSIDGFRSQSGFFTAGIRTEVRHQYGAGIAGATILNEELFHIAKQLSKAVNYRYAFNLELKADVNGAFKILEINPRFAAGVDHTVKAGLNIPLMVVDEVLNGEVDVKNEYNTGIEYRKYWTSICK